MKEFVNGNINLYNKDCFLGLKEIEDKSIDYTFTSPPYNRKRNDKYEQYDDRIDDYFNFNKNIIEELIRVTKKHVIYNIQANYYNRADVYKLIGYFNKNIVDIHIWEKTNPMPASGNSITNAVEYFIIIGKESLKSNKTYTKNIISTSVNSSMPKNHKAVMKKQVAEHFILNFTKENDLILDCFSGMCTTGLVCLENNRKYIGFEISEVYFKDSIELIKKDLNELTLF